MIPRRSSLPSKPPATRTFYTVEDDQESIRFPVLEGEGRKMEDCKCIGEFTVNKVPKGQAGSLESAITVTLAMDRNGTHDRRHGHADVIGWGTAPENAAAAFAHIALLCVCVAVQAGCSRRGRALTRRAGSRSPTLPA